MTTACETPSLPSQEDAVLAREARVELARLRQRGEEELKVQLDDGRALALPKAVTDLLHHILDEMSAGNAVRIIPIHAELTTQEAADILNVSRPYVVKLLEEGKIPFHMAGTHRRVFFRDLDAYRRAFEERRQRAMEELAAEAQELGLGY